MALSHSVSECQSDKGKGVGNSATKLVAMASSLKISEKEGRIDHLQFNAYQWCKDCEIGQADPKILRLRAKKSGRTQNWLPWQRRLRY